MHDFTSTQLLVYTIVIVLFGFGLGVWFDSHRKQKLIRALEQERIRYMRFARRVLNAEVEWAEKDDLTHDKQA